MFRLVDWIWLAAAALTVGCGGGGAGTGGQGGGGGGAGGVGNAYCLLTHDGGAPLSCMGFEGFVNADAEANEVAACTQFGQQSLNACPGSPTGCCLENGNTPHAFYTCYYDVTGTMLGIGQSACSTTNGVWQSSVPF